MEGLNKIFGQVEYVKWGEKGMPRSIEEIMQVIKFVVGRLRSRRGVLKGPVDAS